MKLDLSETFNLMHTDITAISFNQSLVEHFIPGFNGVFDILRRLGVRTMSDVLNVKMDDFLMAVGGTPRRWQRVEELQRILTIRKAEVEQYFTYCVECHEFPVLEPSQEDLPLEEKAALALSQMAQFLQEASIYDSKYARAYMKMLSFIIKEEDKAAQMERFSVSSAERVRQLRVGFFAALRDGHITGVDNAQFSDEFIIAVRKVADTLPMYASKSTLCEAYECDYENSSIRHFLDYKEVYGEQNNNQYAYFDQPYYIPTQQQGEDIKKYITAVIVSLGKGKDADIRPLSLQQVMDDLEDVYSDYDFDQDVVESILKQHTWIEKVTVDRNERYQLYYEFLNDYQKLARIVYEKGRITNDELKAELEKRGSDRAAAIIKSLRVASVKYNWMCLGGQNGVYEYNPAGVSRKPMAEAIRAYAQEKVIFTWDEIYDYLCKEGYSKLVESSIRTYITSICRCSVSDGNTFCLEERVEEYPHINWRSRTQNGLYNWLLPTLVQYLKTTGGKSDCKTIRTVLLARNTQNFKLKNDIATYLYSYAKGANAYFVIESGKISLTDRAWNLTQDEIGKLGLKNRTPEYYMTTVSCIQAFLQQAEEGVDLMSVIRDKCRGVVESLSDHSFYKIVDKHLPDHIVKEERKGKTYLKLDTAKIEYAPAYEVDSVSSEREETPVLVPSAVVRQEQLPGHREVYSWDSIRRKMLLELAFYAKHWEVDMTLEEAVDKFITFMKAQGSLRLSKILPQAMYEFWYCKNDILDYYRYMMEIATCYEQFLASLWQQNGIAVYSNGLKDVVDANPDMRIWLQYSSTDSFRKIFNKLKCTRNLLAHGQDVDDTLFPLVQKSVEFIALYVYTVAKFGE